MVIYVVSIKFVQEGDIQDVTFILIFFSDSCFLNEEVNIFYYKQVLYE
jgi:hypothetical protein